MKLKAGALNYALFVGVVTAILCFLMIQLAFFNRQLFYQLDKQERVLDNSLSGIAYGLANDQLNQWVDLFDDGQDSAKIKAAYLGLFKLVASTAKKGPYRKSRAALFGFKSSAYSKTALVLANQGTPLKMAGDALISGDAYLSPKGCESAYIEGENYSRDQHIYGKQMISEKKLPAVEESSIHQASLRLKQEALSGDSLLSYRALVDRARQDFWSATLLAKESGNLIIEESLQGNMVIKSNKRIIVSKRARLENICLVAPEIVIESGFEGKLHLIASDSIILKPNSKLAYPSSAILLCQNPQKEGQLRLEKQSMFEGLVYHHSAGKRPKNIAQVYIDEEAMVNGQVYSNKNLMLSGTVHGSVWVNNFILITQSGIYQNHLLGGKINRDKLQKDFAGFAIQEDRYEPEIVEWL